MPKVCQCVCFSLSLGMYKYTHIGICIYLLTMWEASGLQKGC